MSSVSDLISTRMGIQGDMDTIEIDPQSWMYLGDISTQLDIYKRYIHTVGYIGYYVHIRLRSGDGGHEHGGFESHQPRGRGA